MIDYPQPFTVIFDWSDRYQDYYSEQVFSAPDAPVYQVWASDPDDASERGDECAVEQFGRETFRELRRVAVLQGHAYYAREN
ncbi:hypothetical protein ACFV1L_05970 [Kitasatospora sp. NPDC059646]|uniref:hypothetical protein n=1 Tax=Kitasatospora sp. NPDC059646 TaxID=3346893 RepID=UPI0036C948D6